MQHCSFQSQVKLVFERNDVGRRRCLASDQADSIDLDTIIVNFDIMQRRHAFCPSHGLAAFSTLFVAEAARNIGLKKEFVRFSVVLPAGRVDDKIDNVLKENPEKIILCIVSPQTSKL